MNNHEFVSAPDGSGEKCVACVRCGVKRLSGFTRNGRAEWNLYVMPNGVHTGSFMPPCKPRSERLNDQHGSTR